MQGLNVLLVGDARPRPACWDGAAAECVVLSQGLDLLVNRRMQGPDLLGERTRLAAQELET